MNTTKVNAEKKAVVQALQDSFEGAQDFIFTDYRGLSVEQISKLRGKLRERNANYHVIKNTYARLVFKELDYPALGDCLVGPTAIALVHDEAGPVTKELFNFAKETSLLIKGALINGALLAKADVEAFSKLPTRMELLAVLMSTMEAPLQYLVYAMNDVSIRLLRTLQAVAEQKATKK